MKAILSLSACVILLAMITTTSHHAIAQPIRKTGTIVGVVTDKGNNKAGNNGWVEIKADGDEGKGRRYWPAGDPKIGGPQRDILAGIRAVTIGSRVRIEWIDAGDGKDITKFDVLKSAEKK